MLKKPKLSFWQILNMNVGFFGIQYSFGLQQSAVTPIYDFLGASPDQIPIVASCWSSNRVIGSTNYWSIK